MYNEWYGIGSYEGIPVVAGLEALEKKFKSKWRKHFKNRYNPQLSHVKAIVKAIDKIRVETDNTLDLVIRDWDVVYHTTNKRSAAKMVQWLKDPGIVGSGKPRGKNANT